MLPGIPAVVPSLILPDDAIAGMGIRNGVFRRLNVFMFENEQKDRTESCEQNTHTAKQQRQYVDQAAACSGDQSFFGHRCVPRIGLFTFDNSTMRGKGSMVFMKAIVVALPGRGASILLRKNDLTQCFAER